MDGFTLKTPAELKIMAEGGKKLHEIKLALVEKAKVGVSAIEVDELAEKLIRKSGSEPSFKMVKGYSWSTCININSGVVHGIPHKEIIFKEGDNISIDVGLFFKGFHTDTSISFGLNVDKTKTEFLRVGKLAFENALRAIKPDNSYIYDISKNIEDTLTKYGYSPVLNLTGHGIGKNLHEEPYIPCFVEGKREKTLKIISGMALAVEVMYCEGNSNLVKANDGWTILTEDGKIAGLFEDTVVVTEKGYSLIT